MAKTPVMDATDLIAAVNKRFGEDSLIKGNSQSLSVTRWRSGMLPVDKLMDGGIPRGRFIECYGGWSSMKSFVLYKALGACQKQGGKVGLIDTEHSFDPEWAEKLGLDADNILISRPDNAEQGIAVAESLVRQGYDMLGFDSIAAALPKQHQESAPGEDNQPGALARVMSKGLARLTAANRDTSIIFVNQTRSKIGISYGSPMTTSGGSAMGFYACLAPGTKVLRHNGVWDVIENIKPGDELVGFDEYRKPDEPWIKMRRTTVLKNDPVALPAYRIKTDRGSNTVASEHHKWLVNRNVPNIGHSWVWVETKDLKSGDRIKWFSQPWEHVDNYDTAYLSGIFDGEGSVNLCMRNRKNSYKGFSVGFSQKSGAVLDKALAALGRLGFDYSDSYDAKRDLHSVVIRGSLSERMRFLSIVRPIRLLNNLGDDWYNGAACTPRSRWGTDTRPYAEITEIEFIGEHPCYATATTTETLMADGMFSHNSYRLNFSRIGKVQIERQKWDGEKLVKEKFTTHLKIKISIEKSKLSAPVGDAFFLYDLSTNDVDELGYLIGLSLENGEIVQGGGGWLSSDKYLGTEKVQGIDRLKAHLAANPEIVKQLTDNHMSGIYGASS